MRRKRRASVVLAAALLVVYTVLNEPHKRTFVSALFVEGPARSSAYHNRCIGYSAHACLKILNRSRQFSSQSKSRCYLSSMPQVPASKRLERPNSLESEKVDCVVSEKRKQIILNLSGNFEIPYIVPTKEWFGATGPFSDGTLVIRFLEEADIPSAVDLCIEEYGAASKPEKHKGSNGKVTSSFQSPESFDPFSMRQQNTRKPLSSGMALTEKLDNVFDQYENYALGNLVRIGMEQRIKCRKRGQEGKGRNDHNVFCVEYIPLLNEKMKSVGIFNGKPEVIAIAEVSLQPPFKTAPPLVMPYSLKRTLAAFERLTHKQSHGTFLSSKTNLEAYVSNVLVRRRFRKQGVGKLLMAALEQHAKRVMGYPRVTLHCDANPRSGSVAQQMYLQLGYEPVFEDLPAWQTENNGSNVVNDVESCSESSINIGNAVYILDDIPLLYLKKDLK